jgi:hypothetical protein
MPETTATAPSRRVDYITPVEQVPTVYANNITFGITGFDIRIMFGEVMSVAEGVANVQPRVQVNMSWLEAKVLYKFLDANIRMYEERNGSLRAPNIELQIPELTIERSNESPKGEI